ALEFVIENAFRDEAFGLNEDLLYKMTVTKWWDEGGLSSIGQDQALDVHDRISAIQTSAMTMILNPTTLRRAYDNEFRIARDKDALTVAEIMDTIAAGVWEELDSSPSKSYTHRNSMISSLRRNLQRQHVEQLVSLANPGPAFGAAGKPVSTLAVLQLRELDARLGKAMEARNRLDRYTLAHLADCQQRVKQALDAQHIANLSDIRVNLTMPGFSVGEQAE